MNVCEGVAYEPRLYFDQFVFEVGARVAQGNPDIFRNGEQFPIWITHVIAMMRGFDAAQLSAQTPEIGDERLVQNYALRIKGHDTYYMNGDPVGLPTWHNVRIAGSDPISRSTASWLFEKPVVLGQRDVFRVTAQLLNVAAAAGGGPRLVTVSFDGIGMLSKRPYRLAGDINLADTAATPIGTDNFRNDGAEPIVITSMNVQCNSAAAAANPAGDIQQVSVQVRQNGNGTGQNWSFGPIPAGGGGATILAPGALWGPSMGRAVVHRLPGNGWLWQPGQGLDPELHANAVAQARIAEEAVFLGFSGFVVIT